jgi:starch phosphorylase
VDGVQGENAAGRHRLASVGPIAETGEHRFAIDFAPERCGKFDYRIRVYPCHPLLTHPLEMGLMAWV